MIQAGVMGAIWAGTGLAERQFRFTASISALGRDGNIVEPSGILGLSLEPVLLAHHDASGDDGKGVP